MSSPFFRNVWRFNALAIAAVSGLALIVGGYAAFQIARDVFHIPYQARDIARVDIAGQPGGDPSAGQEVLTTGSFTRIGGTPVLWAPVTGTQSYDYRASGKEASSIRNYLFYDTASGASRKLFNASAQVVVEALELRRPDADSSKRAPDALLISYIANDSNGAELRVFYMDTQRSATIARLPGGASNLSWSPDGKTLAFQGFVEEPNPDPAGLPPKPEGADWAPPARVIEGVVYRIDGDGYVHAGFQQVFTAPADGGTPHQLTYQARNHDGRMSWTPDGRHLVFSANAEEGWEYRAVESDIYSLDIGNGEITRLTNREGPEDSPTLSPDGRHLAYVGYNDRRQFYQVSDLYVANADGSNPRVLTASFDRDIDNPQWAGNGSIYFLFADHGVTKLGRISASGGRVTTVLSNIGGTDLGRPYTSGAYSVNAAGRYVATTTSPTRPIRP